jgi:hypothetical protein
MLSGWACADKCWGIPQIQPSQLRAKCLTENFFVWGVDLDFWRSIC